MTGLSILFAVSLSAGNAEFERNANDLAADIALGRLAEETWEKGLSAGVLERKMLANPAAFRNRGEAEKLCREIYAVELEKQYEAAAKAIEERLGVTGEGTAVLSKPPYQEMMEKLFPKAFQAERAAACAAQAKNIALKVKPDETELEAQDDRTVREGLVRRVAEVSGLVVFDENMSYISEKIVDPLLADARKEQKRQQARKPSVAVRERMNAEEIENHAGDEQQLVDAGVIPRHAIRQRQLFHRLRRILCRDRPESHDTATIGHPFRNDIVLGLPGARCRRIGQTHHLTVELAYFALRKVMRGEIRVNLIEHIAIPGNLRFRMVQGSTRLADNRLNALVRRHDPLQRIGMLDGLDLRHRFQLLELFRIGLTPHTRHCFQCGNVG